MDLPRVSKNEGLSEFLRYQCDLVRTEDPSTRMLMLHVYIPTETEQEKPSVVFDATVAMKLVHLETDFLVDDIDRHALMCGAPLAMGHLRELLANMTGRTPFLTLMLPMLPPPVLINKYRVFDTEGKEIYTDPGRDLSGFMKAD